MLDGVMVYMLALVASRQSAVGDTLCPSVCLCDPGAPPLCQYQLIEETDTEKQRFAEGLKKFDDNGKTVLVLGDDSFCRWDSSSLL